MLLLGHFPHLTIAQDRTEVSMDLGPNSSDNFVVSCTLTRGSCIVWLWRSEDFNTVAMESLGNFAVDIIWLGPLKLLIK